MRDSAQISHEAVALRSAASRTYVLEGGGMLTKVFASPVNFRAEDGSWRPIDTTLTRDGSGGFGVAAAGFDLSLPERVGGDEQVGVAKGGEKMLFALRGARTATVEVDGARALYRDVLEGVDLEYVSQPDGVKEALILESAAAADAFAFSLDVGSLRPRMTRTDGIEVVDGSGDVVFTIPPPFMRDAAGNTSYDVAYGLRRDGHAWELVVDPDRGWLEAPGREFPVEVDPSAQVDPAADCSVDSGSPTTSFCASDDVELGWDGNHDHHAMFRFDVAAAVPHGVRVIDAYLGLFFESKSANVNKPLAIHRLTRGWTSSSSWSTYDGANAWTTAGGDFDSRNWHRKLLGWSGTGEFEYWPVAGLVQGWLDEDFPNHGLLLRDLDSQQIANRLVFASSEVGDVNQRPVLGINWDHEIGIDRRFTMLDQSLSDRLSIAANVANGNLVHSADDVQIAGTGLDLSVSRHFNNLEQPDNPLGEGWQLSVGGGMHLDDQGFDQLLIGPTGSGHLFLRQPDHSYKSPTAIDATLSEDGSGHVLTMHKSKEVFRFDAEGDLTAHKDRNGNEISFDYSSPGQLDTITDTQGREIEVDHNGNGEIESLTDWDGRTWSYVHDGSDRLIGYTDPDGKTTSYDYDGDDLVEIEDSEGNVTRLEYDNQGRIEDIKHGYDESTDSEVANTEFAYSGPTAPCGGGDIGKTVVTDPRGKDTTYCHDARLRVTKTVDANGNARSATYTPNSDVATSTAPGSAQTSMGYDSLNNLESVDEPAGEASSFEYTNGSHPYFPTAQTSPQGTGSVFAYDTSGNTTTIGDSSSPASQVEAKLEYNGQAGGSCADDPTTKPGTLRCAIDGKGNKTLYGYDDAGNLTSITPELPLGETTISYDALSRVETVEDGKGQVVSYSYDTLDRVVEIDYGGGDTVSFDYDANGNRVERVDSAHGTSTWAYDELNRRVEDDLPSGDTDYTWDAASNLASLTDAGGTVTYRYDDVNRLADLAEPGGSCSSPVSLCTTFGYTNRGQRERTTYPNDVEQTVTFDASDKPTRVRAVDGPTVLTDFTYDYEEASPGTRHTKLRQSMTDKDGNETTYGYDFLDRLTGAVQRDGSNAVVDDRSYTYDLASNRTQQVVNGTTRSFGYNAANQLCWAYTGVSTAACDSPPSTATTFSHDANGDMTASGAGWEFGYDDRARATNVTWPGHGLAIAFGRATGRPGHTQLTGGARHNTLLGLSREDGTSWTRDANGVLISQRASGGDRHYYLTDARGSVVGLADVSGALARSYRYDAFGRVRSTTGETPNPFQFAGQYREPEVDVYRIGDRYYSAALGRWAQVDPLDRAGNLLEGNRYVYAGSDPVNLRHTADMPGPLGALDQVSAQDDADRDPPVERFIDFTAPAEEPDEPQEPEAPPLSDTGMTPLHEATEFLYSGSDPRQTGVAPGTVEPERAAVIRGIVRDVAGDPLPDVEVAIPDHPEFGKTTTRGGGEFFMAVNGGGPLTVRLELDGYLPVDRTVDVPWQDYVWAEDVVMTELDPNDTAIDLSSPLSPIQVARGSIETDADGSRQATLIFPTGTSAEMVMPNGTELPLEELTVRATEYTVGENGEEAMPAELPPTSGYTYAAEYSADEALAAGATEVRFSQPVVNYTDNFLDFPVGTAVPTGYYDREREAWIPAPNGRIVEILSESGGSANVDVTGSGQPSTSNELQELGITAGELEKLAVLYAPGDSLWRVQMDHFTPWDHNWPYGPPPDAEEPDWRPGPPLPDDSCTASGSVIDCEAQTLGEDVPVVGSEQMLHYQSNRVPGGNTSKRLKIRLLGSTVSSAMTDVDLTVEVAGQRHEWSFAPAANLEHVFEWDGRDGFGRKLNGSQRATVSIEYRYGFVRYQDPGPFRSSFARLSGIAMVDRSRMEVTTSQTVQATLGFYEVPPSDLGGWTLSAHHRYDPVGRMLHMGDGTRRRADNVGLVAERVLGQRAQSGFSPDGTPARDALADSIEDLVVGPDGSVYYTDSDNFRVRRIKPDGLIETVAGTGELRDWGEVAGDGGPATQAQLDYVTAIDIGPDGSLYMADGARIRKVDADGAITTVAGNEVDYQPFDYGGDGGPATDAALSFPYGLAVVGDGSFYISDTFNERIRHVGADGIITTVAGDGVSGYAGDGGPAAEARVAWPHSIEIGPDGSAYFADWDNNRLRRISNDGLIETVAGDGGSANTQHGLPATETSVFPASFAIDQDGAIVFSDFTWVHRIGTDGIVRKFANEPCSGNCPPDRPFAPDGGLAVNLDLPCAYGLAIGRMGETYVADHCAEMIHRIGPALPAFNADDIAVPSPDGREIFEFDYAGRHLRTKDALTGATRYAFGYDSAGRLTGFQDGDGLQTEVERDASGHVSAIVAPFGRRTDLSVGADGYLTALENPADEQTLLGYGSGGLLTSFTTPDARTSEFTYDSAGYLVKDEDAGDGFKEFSRFVPSDDEFQVTLSTRLGRSSVFEFERMPDNDIRRAKVDASGLRSETRFQSEDGTAQATGPDGTTRESATDGDPRFGMQSPFTKRVVTESPGGRRTEVRRSRDFVPLDPQLPFGGGTLTDTIWINGRIATTEFDAALGQSVVTSPEGRATTTTVDSQFRPEVVATPGLTPLVYARDAYGRVESISQGPRGVEYAYDAQGRVRVVSDALDREHGFEYDDADRVVKETLPDLREVGFGYDDDGNLTSITPPSRPAHAFAHTPLGQTVAYTPPDLGGGAQPTTFDWSDDQELMTISKPGGRVVGFEYDAGGRLEAVSHSGGQTDYGYDAQNGNPASAETAGGERTAFDWDGFLPLGETTSGTVAGEVSRTYDDDFQVVSEAVDGGHIAAFDYDDDGLLVGAGGLTFERDPGNGLLVGAEQGVITTDVDRDAFGDPERVGSVTGATVLYEEEYERDDLGRIIEKVERRGTQATIYEYGYDVGGRLETVTKDGTLAATYNYDANGNRVGVDRAGEMPIVGQYDDQDRLTNYGATTYAQDPSGQLASKTEGTDTTSYGYDDLGALRGVTLPNGDEIDYAVDASGRRVAKKVDGVLTQGFLYGRGLGPAAELDGNGDVRSRFVYGTRANVPEYMVRGAQTYRILVDQLGSPRSVVDVSTGVVAQQMDFDEFGRVTQDTNPGFQPFGFAGGLSDADTGLVRFGARDYDPETGRWTAKDPIGFEGGDANLYGYVVGDPVNWADPNGLFLSAIAGAIDAVTPDVLSNAAAGFLDGWTFGEASSLLGVDSWCGASGYGTGSLLAGATPMGLARSAARRGIRGVVGGQRYSGDQDALIQLAKEGKRRGGLSRDDFNTLKNWGDEYGVPTRGPEMHPGRGFGSRPHGHVGPVGHIPVN